MDRPLGLWLVTTPNRPLEPTFTLKPASVSVLVACSMLIQFFGSSVSLLVTLGTLNSCGPLEMSSVTGSPSFPEPAGGRLRDDEPGFHCGAVVLRRRHVEPRE